MIKPKVTVEDFELADFDDRRWFERVLPALCASARSYVTTQPLFQMKALMAAKAYGAERVRYVIASDHWPERPFGVLPFIFDGGYNTDHRYELWSFLGSLFHCAYQPPFPPSMIMEVLPWCPPFHDYFSDDRMWIDEFSHPKTLLKNEGEGWFALPATFEDYLRPMSSKARQNFNRNLRDNADLLTVFDNEYRSEVANYLLPQTQAMWRVRRDECQIDVATKNEHDLRIFSAYPEQAMFQYVYYPNGRPAAMNLAWINNHGVVDMLCLRDMSDEARRRGLGIFCVLKNIEEAIGRGYGNYTLTPGKEKYKTQFICGPAHSVTLKAGSGIDLLFNGSRFWYVSGNPEHEAVWIGESMSSDEKMRLFEERQTVEEQTIMRAMHARLTAESSK